MSLSRWRQYLNNELIPGFENSLKVVEPKVLDIGKSTSWNYKPFFPDSHFIVSDINPNSGADIIDDITDTTFDPNSFDGVIFNGVFEQIKSDIGAEGVYTFDNEGLIRDALDNIRKILQKGGLLLFGAPGLYFPRYGKDRDTGRRLLSVKQGIDLVRKAFKIVEVKAFYNNNDGLEYVYIIGIKR